MSGPQSGLGSGARRGERVQRRCQSRRAYFGADELVGRYTTRLVSGVADLAIFPASKGEIEKFIIRQPPKGEKDDYDSENSWISDGLPSSSRRRRRGDGR